MNRYKKLLILLLILAGIGILFAVSGKKGQIPISPTPTPVAALNTTLSIGDKSFDVSQFVGKSALVATAATAKIEETGAGENAFVTSINGTSADSKKHEFWELVINGQPAQVGAGSYIIQKGDSISWRLSTY